MGSKGFLEFRQKRFSIAFVYVLFSRERSPRGDQGLKTCLLALISNISTTTHLFSSICVCFEGVNRSWPWNSSGSVCHRRHLGLHWNAFHGYFTFIVTFFCWGCIKIIHNFLILFILRTFWNIPKKTLTSRASRFEPTFFFSMRLWMSLCHLFSFHCSLLRSFLVFLMCMCVCVWLGKIFNMYPLIFFI